jgi:hypothetical protein
MQGNIHDCVLQIILVMSLMYSPYILWLLSGTLLEYSFSCRRPSPGQLGNLDSTTRKPRFLVSLSYEGIYICICRGYNSVWVIGWHNVSLRRHWILCISLFCRVYMPSRGLILYLPYESDLFNPFSTKNHPTPRVHLPGLTHELFDASQSLLSRLRKVLQPHGHLFLLEISWVSNLL